MSIIDANRIQTWAKQSTARLQLNQIIRKMIFSNYNHKTEIQLIRFGHSDQHSWDGVLDFKGESPWIPKGNSVWELSVEERPTGKIKRDFEKRLNKELPEGFSHSDTTYIAVTAWKIADVHTLQRELNNRRVFKEVRVFDATTIAEWLEVNLAFRLWFEKEILNESSGTSLLKDYWEELRDRTKPVLSTDLIKAGRADNIKSFQEYYENHNDALIIQSDSPDESVAFVYSALDAFKDKDKKESYLSKSIVIQNTESALRQLRRHEPLTIVLTPPNTDHVNTLSNYGHKVICAVGNSLSDEEMSIRLDRSNFSNFAKSLINMGRPHEDSEIEARICGCSVSIWMIWNIQKKSPYGGNYIPERKGDAH